MNELFKILQYKRPYGSPMEEACIAAHLDAIKGMKSDDFGNRIFKILHKDGKEATTLFSSHTDTVHRDGGMQNIVQDKTKQVLYKDDGECLGADDGAGMWIMIQLIKKQIPGLYIFHRGEECGGLGSSYIAHDTPYILDNITKAIAFDRRGTKDIITRQSGGLCASNEFAKSLSKALDLNHTTATGSFTDTANYTSLVEECTNISVGYYSEHRKEESLDYEYLAQLVTQLYTVDFEALTVSRKKGDRGYSAMPNYSPYSGWERGDSLAYKSPRGSEYDTMELNDIVSFVMNNPMIAADILYDNGITPADIQLAKALTGAHEF